VDYRAGLACNDRYIAERMWEDAKKTWWNTGDPRRGKKGDPVLEQALQTKAESGACSVLAEVLN